MMMTRVHAGGLVSRPTDESAASPRAPVGRCKVPVHGARSGVGWGAAAPLVWLLLSGAGLVFGDAVSSRNAEPREAAERNVTMTCIRKQRRASAEEWSGLIDRARRGGHASVVRALESGASIVVRDDEEVLPPIELCAAKSTGGAALEMSERSALDARVNAPGGVA